MSKSLRWDVHNHAVPVEALEALGDDSPVHIDGDVVSADRVRFRVTPEYTESAAKLAQLEALGLEAAIVSLVPPLFCHDVDAETGVRLARAVNDGLRALVEEEPERLRWLAHLPLQDPGSAASTLETAVSDGAVGAQIATSVAGVSLDRAGLEDLWATAARLEVPIMLHPAYNAANPALDDWYLQNAIGNQLETTVAAERLLLDGVLHRHPSLRLVLVHAGGYIPWQIGRLGHAASVRPEFDQTPDDLVATALRQIIVDTITHDATVLRLLVERMGESNVAMGTDLPFDMAPVSPAEQLIEAVGEATAQRIMHDVPTRVFRLA